MTVKELIAELRKLPPNAEIYTYVREEQAFEKTSEVCHCDDFNLWSHVNVPDGYIIY